MIICRALSKQRLYGMSTKGDIVESLSSLSREAQALSPRAVARISVDDVQADPAGTSTNLSVMIHNVRTK